jgi:hypothetical protein
MVSLNINYEEYVLRALADTGASSSSILEVYTSNKLINCDEEQKSNWSIMGGQFANDKTGLVSFSRPQFNLKNQISCVFHVNDRSKTSSTYDMINGQDLLGELGIILNFNNKTVTWDTETISMNDRGTLNSRDALSEVHLPENEPQSLVKELSRSTKILDAEYMPVVLEDVIKICNILNTEEQYELLKLLQKYEHLFDATLGDSTWLP